MTTTDLDPTASGQDEQAPTSPPPDVAEPAAQDDESEREQRLQERLARQGREVADARRAAAYAQQHAQTLQGTVTELQAQVRLLTESMSEQQRQVAERQQREMDAYLSTLPPEQRLDRKIEILGEQIKQMQRPAVTPSQPAQQTQPQQRQAPQQYTEQDSVEYMRRRAVEIVGEAQQEFGVKVDVSTLDDAAWESEDAFYRAVMREAARASSQNGEPTVPRKPPANETPQQMQQRIRREIQEELGVSSPNGPKGSPRATRKPTDEDVRTLVNGYQSAKGPKAAAAKLREMRERMG
jgi:hypothetical protein